MTMQPVVSFERVETVRYGLWGRGRQAWLVTLACGHTVFRRVPLPKTRALCDTCSAEDDARMPT